MANTPSQNQNSGPSSNTVKLILGILKYVVLVGIVLLILSFIGNIIFD